MNRNTLKLAHTPALTLADTLTLRRVVIFSVLGLHSGVISNLFAYFEARCLCGRSRQLDGQPEAAARVEWRQREKERETEGVSETGIRASCLCLLCQLGRAQKSVKCRFRKT